MKNTQQITALKTFPVRYPVLRAEKPIASCRFDNDTLEIRLLDYDDILGVVSLFEAKNDSFILENNFKFGEWPF